MLPDSTGERLPRRFGRYLLFDRIGRGGMADIYLARAQTDLGAARRVVVKQILSELSRDAHFARMLVEEAKLVAGLRHANIVQVLDLGREGERLFIAMEYVEGFDLNQLLRTLSKRRIALPAQFALFIVREVLAALDFAHRAAAEDGRPLDIVHRDVSPSNVLISFEGEVKLCDFGIAKAIGASAAEPSAPSSPSRPRSTEEGSGERSRIAGKAAYMSPEHARGDEIDARADVFAAGIVLWELAAGRRLYRGSEEQMLALAREGAVPPLPERGLPEAAALQAILDRAFAYDPAERWQSAAQMLRAIDEYAARAKLFASQLRFGSFLSEHFEAEVVRVRRDRERAAEALDRGPAVEIEPTDHTEPSGADRSNAPATPAPGATPPDASARGGSSDPPADPEPSAAPEGEASSEQRQLASLDTKRLRASHAPARRSRAPLALAALVLLAALAALAWALLAST